MNRPVLVLCAAEGLTLIGVFAFPALLPTFQAEWSLTNAQAGWIAGVYFLGYALAVPALSSLTDRIDARSVFLAGAAVCALAAGGFALFAQGLASAMAFRFLGGVGLAGVYMPGLKALVDRERGAGQARAISYYTACFSLGTMLSFLLVGEMAQHFGWQAAFAFAGLAALIGVGLAAGLTPVCPETAGGSPGGLLDFRPVLKNRAAMGYILGYVCHMWELFTFRAWMVAFLVLAQSRNAGTVDWQPTTVATLCSAVAMAASLAGADLALRFDRRRLCTCAMLGSGSMALILGGCLAMPYGVTVAAAVFYTALVQLDSAALTTGAMLSADPARRGATVALHSLLGFSAAFFGPLAQGALLDGLGGAGQMRSWVVAFALMGAVGLLGPLALAWGRRTSPAGEAGR